MAFSRSAILRNLRSLRSFRGRSTVTHPQFNQVARRTYASGSHEHAKSGGDAVWAAGAVAVTIPATWFLISNKPDKSHGHGGHGDSHGAHAEEHEEVENPEEEEDDKPVESKEETEEQEEPKQSDESDSDEAKEQSTPATSDDDSIPDVKGGNKPSEGNNKDPSDKPAESKEPQGKNTQSGKQEGLSNTDTKHSTDITNDPSKSKKGEGAPETAKVKGTVDSNRPQV